MTQTPTLPLRCVYASLSCIRHPFQFPFCSLQSCKSLHFPLQSQLSCPYLAQRLPTTTPILCHQILPRHRFKSRLGGCMPPTLHSTTLWPDRIFWHQLSRLPRHWPLCRRIYDFSQRCAHQSQFYHANTNCNVNLWSQIHGHIFACMATAHIHMLLYNMTYLRTKQWRESTQCLPTIPSILMIDNKATIQIARNGKVTADL